MPRMLRHRKTGEVVPMNADLQRHDDMVAVDVPDVSKLTSVRGVTVLEEKYVFEDVEEPPTEPDSIADPTPPAPKPRRRRAKKDADPTTGDASAAALTIDGVSMEVDVDLGSEGA